MCIITRDSVEFNAEALTLSSIPSILSFIGATAEQSTLPCSVTHAYERLSS
jgi:hypothetical protein